MLGVPPAAVRRLRALGLKGLLAVALVVAAAPRTADAARRGQALRLDIGLTTTYDDNLLEYSDSLLAVFAAGTRPDQFSIETRDDVIWSPTVGLTWENTLGRHRVRSVRAAASADFHTQNGTADFRAASIRWREPIGRARYLQAGLYRLPRYYLRQLYDDDAVLAFSQLSRYRRAEFGLTVARASLRTPLTRRFRADLDYRFERRGYNPDFVARTSSLHQSTATVGWTRLPGRGVWELTGGFQRSTARGADADDTTSAVPDDPDIGFHGPVVRTAARAQLARVGAVRIEADAAYELERRVFDSDRPADRYHFGRHDLFQGIEAGLGVAARRHWSARLFGRREMNDATLGAAAPTSTDLAGYDRDEVGLTIDWAGDLWRGSGAHEEGDDAP